MKWFNQIIMWLALALAVGGCYVNFGVKGSLKDDEVTEINVEAGDETKKPEKDKSE